MKDIAKELNIKGHEVGDKGNIDMYICRYVDINIQDYLLHRPMSSSQFPLLIIEIYGPFDIEVHMAKNGRYYLLDTARVFPPEKRDKK